MHPVLLSILTTILEAVGAAVVRRQIDYWEAGRKAADVAEDLKFGPEGGPAMKGPGGGE